MLWFDPLAVSFVQNSWNYLTFDPDTRIYDIQVEEADNLNLPWAGHSRLLTAATRGLTETSLIRLTIKTNVAALCQTLVVFWSDTVGDVSAGRNRPTCRFTGRRMDGVGVQSPSTGNWRPQSRGCGSPGSGGSWRGRTPPVRTCGCWTCGPPWCVTCQLCHWHPKVSLCLVEATAYRKQRFRTRVSIRFDQM